MASARRVPLVVAIPLALAVGACSDRLGPLRNNADASASRDAVVLDGPMIDGTIDAPTATDARAALDAIAIADATARDAPSTDAPRASDAPLSDSATMSRDAAGCPCSRGGVCVDEGDIVCAPDPDYPCATTDGWYAVCTPTGWECRFTTPALC